MPITQEQVDAEQKLIDECNFISHVVANEIKKKFGWKPDPKLLRYSQYNGRAFFEIAINEDLGIFASIIKKVCVSVAFEKSDEDNTYWVKFGLDYQHHNGGRNGKDIGTLWVDGTSFKVTTVKFDCDLT